MMPAMKWIQRDSAETISIFSIATPPQPKKFLAKTNNTAVSTTPAMTVPHNESSGFFMVLSSFE
jgi:hypothetical protein